MRQIEIQIVSSNKRREQVAQHADGVVLSENEVGELANAPNETEIPEEARDDRLLHFARRIILHEPAAAEHERPGKPDDFHWCYHQFADLEQCLIHARSLQPGASRSIPQIAGKRAALPLP